VTQVRRSGHLAVALAVCLTFTCRTPAAGELDDSQNACDRAAAGAETTWQLPVGLLSAIGIVESGRSDLNHTRPVPWPWTMNFDGRGYYLPDKQEAVQVVSTVRAAGRQVIDVGCFQVNLFYHPEAFASVEDAFDPDANAQAAARILARARVNGNSWEAAIGLYHSASPDRAAVYLRQVQAAWPWARINSTATSRLPATPPPTVAQPFLVVNAADIHVSAAEGLPRILGPQTATGILQWTAMPSNSLPLVLMPPPKLARPTPARHFLY
jgi:hypothetical protein